MSKIKFFFIRLFSYLMLPIAWVWWLFHRKASEDMLIIKNDDSDTGT